MKFRSSARGAVVGLLAAGLLMSGCAEGKNSKKAEPNADAPQPVLQVHATSTPTHQPNFNPFASAALVGTKGLVYEPLMIFTQAKPGEDIPSLAEKMSFNSDGTKVTFNLRKGVNWSDGKPFTSKDVVYTFNQMVKEPAMNTSALPIVSAEASDDHTVVVTFKDPVFSRKPLIGQIMPIPEHIFAAQPKVMDFTNEKPVGTGPYTLKNFSPQVFSYVKNDGYWDKDNIRVKEIAYPASTKETFNTDLSMGKLDWSSGFVANIDQIFVAKDPQNHKFWYPADGNVNLFLNIQRKPMDDLQVRKAFSLALNREEISDVVDKFRKPANPTGIILPAQASMLDPKYKDAKFEFKSDEANKILDAAGYAKGADGVRVTPAGERMSYDLIVPTGWVDVIAMTKIIQEQFKAIGVEIKPGTVAQTNWLDARKKGDFHMTIAPTAAGMTPYFHFRSFMSSEFKAEPGQPATSNQNRYYNPKADEFFKQYESTDDPEVQKKAIYGLQQIMMEDLPTIPIIQSANFFQYSTKNFVGWPTEADPYAMPAAYNFPDNILVVKKLKPAK